jgi:hypothetical protein
LLVIGGRERTFFFFFEEIIKLLGQIKRKRENRDAVGWDSLSRFYAIYLFLIFFSLSLSPSLLPVFSLFLLAG